MRKINQLAGRLLCRLFFVAGMCGGLAACGSDELDKMDLNEELTEVSLSVTTRVGTDDPESQIKSLRVYAYDGARLAGHYEQSNLTGISHTFKMKLPETAVTFYVVANEKAAGELKSNNSSAFAFAANLSAAELKAVTFSSLPNDVAANGLPMTAVYQTTVQRKTPITIDNLKRSVAKLNIYMVKKGSESAQAFMNRGIYLYNEPAYGYLFADNVPYDGAFNYKESGTTGDQTDGNNQQNGKVLLSADWKNDQDGTIVWGNNEVLKTFIPGMKQEPTNYQRLPDQCFYLFANPYDGRTAEAKQNAYYLKFGWSTQYQENGKNITDYPEVVSIYLPTANANDNLQFFAHISVTSTLINEFNWYVSPWMEAGGDIEFD